MQTIIEDKELIIVYLERPEARELIHEIAALGAVGSPIACLTELSMQLKAAEQLWGPIDAA